MKGRVTHKRKSFRVGKVFLGAAAFVAVLGGVYALPRDGVRASEPTGPVKTVIVKLKGVSGVTSALGSVQSAQKAQIKAASLALNSVGGGYIEKVRDYTNLPYAVYTVDAAGEAALKADGRVESMTQDKPMKALTTTPIPTVGGDTVLGFSDGSTNYTGNGYAVAIVDSGVDKNHPALAGKVISEACFGINATYTNVDIESLCPGGAVSSTADGSGQACTLANGCDHGTEVAGAAAMKASLADIDSDGTADKLSGVATGAKIVAIQVNVKVTEKDITDDWCDDGAATLSSCAKPMQSAFIAGLDYVATLSASVPIAAANLSIGGAPYAGTDAECSAQSEFNSVATALRAHNIAPIVASGNSGDLASQYDKIGSPACATGAIAVSATNIAGTAVASYSNNGPLTDLLAPGGDIVQGQPDSVMWLPKNGTQGLTGGQGTSYAAPMVAGAYAVLREAHPNATVDQLTTLLQNTGKSVTDTRPGYTVGAKKLIQLDAALAAADLPIISTFTGPTGTVNEGSDITLNLAAANVSSCTLDNGIGAVTVTSTASTKKVPAKASYTLACTGAYGDTASKTLSFTVNPAPTQPGSVRVKGDNTARTFLVQWDASTDANNVANYKVYVNGNLVATLEATALSYLMSNVQYGQAYTVKVTAVDTLGAESLAANLDLNMSAAAVAPAPGVPNTGVGQLAAVQPWQLIALIVGAFISVSMIMRTVKARK